MTYQKNFVIDARQSMGFFSNILQIIDNIYYCNMNNYKLIIRFNNFLYSDGRQKIFEYFFQPINDGIIDYNIETEYFNWFKMENFVLNDKGLAYLWDILDINDKYSNNREIISQIIADNLKPVNFIQQSIDNFYNDHMLNSNVLGVHIRGTDYRINLDMYYQPIDEYLANNKIDKLLVSSDNFEAINNLKNRYSNVINYETDLRMDRMTDPVLCHNKPDKLKLGSDVLIESNLLSKCDYLIHINSNVSLYSIYLNKHLKHKMIYRSNQGG